MLRHSDIVSFLNGATGELIPEFLGFMNSALDIFAILDYNLTISVLNSSGVYMLWV